MASYVESFVGELRLMSFPNAPKGWAYCEGQLLQIDSNKALFALLGKAFGGDGITTFALPDLRGHTPIGQGRAASGTVYTIGQRVGQEEVALTVAQMPQHGHELSFTLHSGTDADSTTPEGTYPGNATDPANNAYTTGGTDVTMGAVLTNPTLAEAGGDQAHANMQPYLTLNYAISLYGIYPQRT